MTDDERPSELPPHLDPRRPKAREIKTPRAPASVPAAATVSPGRPKPGRSRGQRFGRALSWIALTMATVLLALVGTAYFLVGHYVGKVNHLANILGTSIPGHTSPPKAPKDAANYLLVGSDSRAGSSGVGTQGSGSTFVTGQRSDTVILIHLFANSDKAQLVSFPRDSYVEIPAHVDPASHRQVPAHKNKLNSAFADGGPALLIATIEQLTDVRVDHFLQIDFAGFKGMVDQLGGVDVCLTKPAKDIYSRIDLSAGPHHINGEVALSFVRQRHGLANGDIDRITRQQQFIGALVRQVLSAHTLLNPFKLTGFLDVATSSLTVDAGLSANDFKNLALRLRGFNAGGVVFTTIPISDIGGYRSGVGSVVLLDEAKDAELFQQLQQDRPPNVPPPGKTAAAPTLTVPPAAVRVAVFNGSGVNGLGRKAATDLTGVGFDVIGSAQTRGTGAAQTMVLYGPTKADSAKTVAAAIPGAVLVADPTLGRTVQVVVGSSYHGAVKVTVSPSPAPSSGASAAPAPPVTTAANNICTA